MSTSSDDANVIVSIADGCGVGDPADADVELAQPAAMQPVTPAIAKATQRRAARAITSPAGVDRSREALTQRRVAADDRFPGELHSVATALGNDLDAFRRDRDGEDLAFVLKLALDALVEFRRH